MSGSKTRYTEFCQAAYVPLHLQSWWLDAVCGPQAWEAAAASDRQGIPGGVLPYFKTRYGGLPVVRQPPLTSYAGPWFHPDLQEIMPAHQQLAAQHRIMQELIGQLPRVLFFQQCFRPEIQNWLPFYWAGFRQTTRYTYVLPDTTDLPGLYRGLKNTLRTDLRRAEQGTEILTVENPEPIFRLNAQSFARKGRRQPYSLKTFQNLHNALAVRRQSLALLARDREQGALQAGLYLAFDSRQAAVLLSGFDPAHSHAGALHSLYWRAVQFCAARKLRLDFEGSMQPGIERVFRGFGGRLTPYFQVRRI